MKKACYFFGLSVVAAFGAWWFSHLTVKLGSGLQGVICLILQLVLSFYAGICAGYAVVELIERKDGDE